MSDNLSNLSDQILNNLSAKTLSSLPVKPDNSGFTLIEVIVAMVLVSMITLIMAFALKINLDAWERGNSEGDKFQIGVVLPNMLERQLRYIVSSAALSNTDSLTSDSEILQAKNSLTNSQQGIGGTQLSQIGAVTNLKVSGNEKSLSFYTLYSPQGTPSQGLIRVAYIYDEDAKELTVYEKVIGSEDDIKDSDGLFSGSGKFSSRKSGSGKLGSRSVSKNFKSSGRSSKFGKKSGSKFDSDSMPVSTISDVEKFSLSFLEGEDSSLFQDGSSFSSSSKTNSAFKSSNFSKNRISKNGSSFNDSWDQDSPNPPAFIKLLFAQTKRKGGTPSVWLFKVGGAL
ncbi:MAG: prepilin-type N-terminal cleavage/methylation domain-containing protein [Desulfamplus sp.]|nr:prepilin-type N-terminal cleavage/methylation domain-containing protein [Desulfamplus sp.]